ncbi:C-type cyclin [Apiospora phragmitis]|uniref:C-type cyclin n=1 Tax=Apiospora phragmitis TaxID=2905665 RepID=A0ABR1X706_9PEZI
MATTATSTADDTVGGNEPRGPDPGRIITKHDFICEQHIQMLTKGVSKEEQYRLGGVALIESVRENLGLSIRYKPGSRLLIHFAAQPKRSQRLARSGINSVCTMGGRIFHSMKQLLLASGLLARRRTPQKKSKEVVCASWNISNPTDQRTPDDKAFEKRSQSMIGIERMLIETLAFNLNARYPLGMMVKLIKKFLTKEEWSTEFYPVAWDMAFDIYKTFAPLKKTTWTVALSLLELTSRLTGIYQHKILAINCEEYQVSRAHMLEVMSDLLDLYTQSHKHTRLGPKYPLDRFIEIKITINKEIEDRGIDFTSWCQDCEFHAPKPPFPPASRGGIGNTEAITKRFIFDRDAAREEQEITRPYFEDDFEEYETEVEEEVHPSPRDPAIAVAPNLSGPPDLATAVMAVGVVVVELGLVRVVTAVTDDRAMAAGMAVVAVKGGAAAAAAAISAKQYHTTALGIRFLF